jgi:hypothetical protein
MKKQILAAAAMLFFCVGFASAQTGAPTTKPAGTTKPATGAVASAPKSNTVHAVTPTATTQAKTQTKPAQPPASTAKTAATPKTTATDKSAVASTTGRHKRKSGHRHGMKTKAGAGQGQTPKTDNAVKKQ